MSKPIETLKNSGKQPGLQIWAVRIVEPAKRVFPRIFAQEQPLEVEYELIAIPKQHHGIFYSEDMYVVLKTNEISENRNIHFWFGKDYKDNAPKWVDSFEDLELNWKAYQHFDFQGHECELFDSYFKSIQPAIRYKQGRQPDPGAERKKGITRFYKLICRDKGYYRVKEIPFNIALMTKEDCFILDSDYNTRAYISDRSSVKERNKSVTICNNLRELEHNGEGDIEVVDLTTFTNESDKNTYLGKNELLDDNEPEIEVPVDFDKPDDTVDNVEFHMVSFIFSDDIDCGYPPRFRYIPKPKSQKASKPKTQEEKQLPWFSRVKQSMVAKAMKLCRREKNEETVSKIPSIEEKFFKSPIIKPLKKELLSSKKCYMLEESGGKSLYLWIGKSCDPSLKEEITESVRLELRRGDPANVDRINKKDFGQVQDNIPYTKADEDQEAEEEEEDPPRWTHIYKVIDENEPVKFKKYFQDFD